MAEAERELARRAQALARANEDLDHFAYVASHDLSEPLRVVSGFVNLLAQRYAGQLDSDADVYIGYAVDGCTRMEQLIRDLATYSRLRGDAPAEPVDCRAALEDALVALAPAIEESSAAVEIGPLPTVVANPTQVTQLWENLVGNAVKFGRTGVGPRVEVAARREGGEWTLLVRDDGIGIEPRYRDRVFRMFQRLHGRDEYPGTGIGLAICQKIVEGWGGRIWAEETPGGGTTVLFTVPARSGGGSDPG